MKIRITQQGRLLRYVWPSVRPNIGESRLTTRRSTSSFRRCFRK
jgi:hypothetical protein